MPIYEYECTQCGERLERLQRLDDPPPDACESCGGSMRRLVSAPAFQFKGSGWYVTDYARRGSGGDSGSAEKADADSSASEKKPVAGEGASGKGDAVSSTKSETGGAASAD